MLKNNKTLFLLTLVVLSLPLLYVPIPAEAGVDFILISSTIIPSKVIEAIVMLK